MVTCVVTGVMHALVAMACHDRGSIIVLAVGGGSLIAAMSIL